jgi:hypothetical protein
MLLRSCMAPGLLLVDWDGERLQKNTVGPGEYGGGWRGIGDMKLWRID